MIMTNSELKAERRKKEKAAKKLNQVIQLYNSAWTEGKTLFDDEILKILQRASSKCAKCLALNPDIPEALRYSKLINCKIVGDERIKKGRTCHRQGLQATKDRLYDFAFSRYEDALTDFRCAMENYEEGMMRWNDSKFKGLYCLAKDEMQYALKEREDVRPFKEAEEQKREAERLLREKIHKEMESQRVWDELEREVMKKQMNKMNKGLFGQRVKSTSLTLISNSNGGSQYFGTNSPHPDKSKSQESKSRFLGDAKEVSEDSGRD